MKDNKLTFAEATAYAVIELGLEYEEHTLADINKLDDLFEIVIRTICMEYTVYVQDFDGFVCGISAEPQIDFESAYYENYRYAA